MTEAVLFYAFAGTAVIAALLTVTVKNIFHSALYLALSLFGVAAIFGLLGSYFLAGLQVLLYIGAVVVLSIFVISMTKHVAEASGASASRGRLPALLTALLTLGLLVSAIARTRWETAAGPAVNALSDDAAAIGRHILTDFVLPFEIVSVLLLAALLGAVSIIAKDNV
jgi:NADH-quinone oxidoreductase subunit J